jgi:hypothetical protein
MINGTDNTFTVQSCTSCPVCGSSFSARSGRGRPRLYCSENCAEVAKYWDAFQSAFDKVSLSSDVRKVWRSELFLVSNSLCRKSCK